MLFTRIHPLVKALYYLHETTVQPLLQNGANVNLFAKNEPSPPFILCQKRT